jgi:hypothetical protein
MSLKSTIIIIYDNPKQCTIPIHGLHGEKYNIQKKLEIFPTSNLLNPVFFLKKTVEKYYSLARNGED